MIQRQGRRVGAIVKLACVAPVLLSPLLATAQFVAVTQTVSTSSLAVSELQTPELVTAKDSKLSALGDLSSQSLRSDSTVQGLYNVMSYGGAGSTIEAGRIGVTVGAASVIKVTDGANIYLQGGYANGRANSSAAASVTFDLANGTDVLVTGIDLYKNMGSFSTYQSSLSLSRLGEAGQLIAVASRDNLFGVTHLDAGRYVLSSTANYDLTIPDALRAGLYGGNANLLITAVPEPSTMLMLGLGMLALSFGMRRKK